MRLLPAVALLLVPTLASADRITVKGTTLEGTVKSISAKEIVVETIYGKGDLTIPTADVSAIATDTPFHVHTASGAVEVGSIVAIQPSALTIVRADGERADIPFDQVLAAPREAGEAANWLARRHVESPWWSGHADLQFASFDASTHTAALATGFGAERARGAHRTKLGATYLRSTTSDDEDDPDTLDVDESDEEVTGDELRGFVRQEYHLNSVFLFGSLEAEHDGIESLSMRVIPKVGAGYKIADEEDLYVAVDAGVAFVYESLFGPHHNSYAAVALGGEHKWKLPWLGASWYSRIDYLPSVTDPLDDYRARGETGLLVPVLEQLSFKASVIDEYNSEPADDATANSLATMLGLSLIY